MKDIKDKVENLSGKSNLSIIKQNLYESIISLVLWSLLYCYGPDLVPHAWAVKATITLVIFEPFVKAVLMKLMAAFALYNFTCYWWVSTLYAMRTDSLQLVLTNWASLTLWITHPTCYCIPLYYLENLCILFLHSSKLVSLIF